MKWQLTLINGKYKMTRVNTITQCIEVRNLKLVEKVYYKITGRLKESNFKDKVC